MGQANPGAGFGTAPLPLIPRREGVNPSLSLYSQFRRWRVHAPLGSCRQGEGEGAEFRAAAGIAP
jgi:hypothetical protein